MEYIKNRSRGSFVLLIILACWLLVSFSRISFNVYRLSANEFGTFFFTNLEKEKSFYKDLLTISVFIKSHTDTNDAILLKGDDGQLYFFLRYKLFPQKVYWVNNLNNYKELPTWQYVLYAGDSLPRAKGKAVLILRSNTNMVIGKFIKEK